ncbi:DUF6443 domain-containing protein [Flavivirga abyssicola]|uniref:DUF6443 domain-containing protein n=1 Tax=Flavivirga abyssicola TaxID=3063533 RepID=UPI0026E04E86|nr:DUF6443 domain-containing protein [Flavivirga sp. MEBiC07777]WVK12879.1 DUF6443 domain-containing protein [Flavivirga sp. MEBiC07777]
MKKLLFTLVTLCVSSLMMAQTTTENYVKTTSYQIKTPTGAVSNDYKIEGITYYDGLGRPKQSIGIRAGGNREDIITYIDYDEFGRQDKEYLPYAISSNGASYITDAKNATLSYYDNAIRYDDDFLGMTVADINPYSQKRLEDSPLSRVLSQAAPGKDWKQGSGNEIEFDYQSNTNYSVAKFSVDLSFANNTYTPTLIIGIGADEFYDGGELSKTITKDENWQPNQTYPTDHTIEEFKDKQGRVVLKRTYGPSMVNGVLRNNENHDTYYVYDDYGNLSFVIPPKSYLGSELSELCYQYKYDNRNRLVEKKIPGKGWEYIVYDKADRPILTQDAKQKTTGEWLFTKYDIFGRVAYTGKATSANTTTREAVQEEVNNFIGNLWVTQANSYTNFGGVNMYYNNGGYPNNDTPEHLVTLSEILTVNYYDTYVDRPSEAPTSVVIMESPTNENNAANTKGLATVRKVKVLDVPGTNAWINTLTYYDGKSRPIYVYSENTYLGTVDIVETKLDFVGKPLKNKTTHIRNNVTIATLENFTYDHVGRLKTQTQCIGDQTMGYVCASVVDLSLTGTITTDQVASNSITITNATISPNTRLWIDPEPQEVIVNNTYDELGQLESKGVGGKILNSNRLQTIDYAYNVRGWLKNINQDSNSDNDLFNFTIKYNDIADVNKKLYNGNISQTSWNTLNSDSSEKTYTYTYDALNRITSGIDNTTNQDYSLQNITYDKNGNITSLLRKGHLNDGASGFTFGIMDNLNYTYNTGNKLQIVSDSGSDTFGFKDDFAGSVTDTTTDYTYDANGNMLTDANKGISTNITYNHLNLPTQVVLNGGNISYIYDATGVKLKKIVSTGATTEYAGNYVYENGSLKFFNHVEGYVSAELVSGSVQYDYVYQYKDHLGNVRLSYSDTDGNGSITASTEILEENNYYPFGGLHKGYNTNVSSTNPAQKYKYNGKELQDELGLDWYDYGARNYDPYLGRWMNIDPLAEKYYEFSGYNYTLNNPIVFTDPDGQRVEWGENLSDEEKQIIGRFIYDLRKNSKVFNKIFETLHSSENIYTVGNNGLSADASFDPDKGVPGVEFDEDTLETTETYDESSNKGGTIRLPFDYFEQFKGLKSKSEIVQNSLVEEFVHAAQWETLFPKSGMTTLDFYVDFVGSNFNNGNFEFEAKALSGIIHQQGGVGYRKGGNLIAGNYGRSVYKSGSFNSSQYFKSANNWLNSPETNSGYRTMNGFDVSINKSLPPTLLIQAIKDK